jgi:hypothetical protein
MAQLYDVRNNEYLGQIDQITGSTLSDARPATASLGAVNAEALVDLQGHATLAVDIRGTFVGTAVFEGTVDGTNYVALVAYNTVTAIYVASVTAAANLSLNVAGYRRVRVRCSAYTSGAIVVALRATTADFATLVERIPATAGLTATGAAAAAVTLTIPAPGAGLYQYVNWIKIQHFASALLVAAAAPVIVTTTNLPGTPSFNFRADAAPQGTMSNDEINNGMPIRGITANTAITVVCPATTSVIWKVSASWRVGA